MTLEQKVDLLIAKDQIRDLISKYVYSADRGNLADLASVYHEDAIDERPYNAGTTVSSFIETIRAQIKNAVAVQHDISSVSIEVAGDYAESECFVTTTAFLHGPSGPLKQMSGSRYLDKLERRSGVWKFTHRRVVNTWRQVFAGEAMEVTAENTPDHMRSQMGAADPATTFFTLRKNEATQHS